MSAVTACNKFSKRYPKAVAPYENWLLEGNCNPNDVREESADGECARYRVQPPVERAKGSQTGWMSLVLDFMENEEGTAHFHRAQIAFGSVPKDQAFKVSQLLWEQQTQMSAPFRYFSFERDDAVVFGIEYSFIGEGVSTDYRVILLDELLRHAREIYQELSEHHEIKPFLPPDMPREAA